VIRIDFCDFVTVPLRTAAKMRRKYGRFVDWTSSTHVQVTLSERNTVELIIKLRELSYLGNELLFTTSGREYITRDKLKDELYDTLNEHGGRLSLVDLPTLMGMDLGHCQTAAESLAKEKKDEVSVMHGEVFSSVYFDDLMSEIDENLQVSGVLALGDVARANGLTMEMVTSKVTGNVGTVIHGKLDGGVLYTESFIQRVKSQLRGALRGATVPLVLTSLKKDLGLDALPAVGAFLPSLTEDLVKDSKLAGKLVSGSWIPDVYESGQQEAVKAFYSQNHYLSKSYMNKHGIDRPDEYMKKLDPDSIILDTCFASNNIIHPIVASLEESVQAGSWADVQDLVPGDLTQADAIALLEFILKSSPSFQSSSTVFADRYVVSNEYIHAIRLALEKQAEHTAREDHQKKKSEITDESKQKIQTQRDIKNTSDDEDDWDTSGKGGKGKKGKGKKKGKQPVKNQKNASNSKQVATDNTSPSFKSIDNLVKHVLELNPDVDGYDDLVMAIAKNLLPFVATAYDAAANEIFTAGAARRKSIKDAASRHLQSSFNYLELFSNGAKKLFAEDEEQCNALNKHLMRTTASSCVDALLYFLLADVATQEDDDILDVEQYVQTSMSASQRVAAIDHAPSDLSQPLAGLASSLQSNKVTRVDEFQTTLQDVAESSGVRIKPLDKKTESRLVQELKNSLTQQIEIADYAPTILSAAVPLIALKRAGSCVSIPGRSLGPAIKALNSSLEPDEFVSLDALHQQVVAHLKGDDGSFLDDALVASVKKLAQE
jgi:hypothetical protein